MLAMLLLTLSDSAFPAAQPTVLQYQSFGAPRHTQRTAAWGGLEASAIAGLDDASADAEVDDKAAPSSRQLHMLPSVLSPTDVDRVMDAATIPSAEFDMEGDTVDDEAVCLRRIVDDGSTVDDALYAAVAPLLEERLLPYVRAKYDCPTACVADVLVRRYLPSERRRLAVHFDVSSFATAIVSLSAADDYEGGLYVQATPGVASRRFVPLQAGDGLVHQYDTMHGVQVRSGCRFSLVVWFSDSPASLGSGRAPWVERAARRGNVEAMFVLAGFHERGNFGYAADARLAMVWLLQAAERGQPLAQLQLAQMLVADEVSAADADEIARRVLHTDRAAAPAATLAAAGGVAANGSEGNAAAEGIVAAEEAVAVERKLRLAAELNRRVAAYGHPMAQYLLGRAYLRGEGVEVDVTAAEAWLRRAAAQGADSLEDEVVAARWAEEALEELHSPAEASLADEWSGLSPEERQGALDEINEQQRLAGEPEWDMAALCTMMGTACPPCD